METHVFAPQGQPKGYPQRFRFPQEKIPWAVEFLEYAPPYYVAKKVLENDGTQKPGGWADPEDMRHVDVGSRKSFVGKLNFDLAGRPLNPFGRTGIGGRGLLGKWGPNNAADALITRINPQSKLLEILIIVRRDNGNWALPGGMVDHADSAVDTATRELREEALGGKNLLNMRDSQLLYTGYSDGARNTDHAWIETSVFFLHLDEKQVAVSIQAGDDAADAFWLSLSPENLAKVYPNHVRYIQMALNKMALRTDTLQAAVRQGVIIRLSDFVRDNVIVQKW